MLFPIRTRRRGVRVCVQLSLLAAVGCALPLHAAGRGRAVAAAVPDFRRDIRPILSENCFQCHGPDAAKRAASLRLDIKESALAARAVVPGKPQQSRLISRVFAPEGRQMPPPSTKKRLTADQKETLRRWVAAGAVYQGHWAFEPLPARVPSPAVTDAGWARSDLDRFVWKRLAQDGLKPSPDADPAIWLRRVTLDLTGLLPTPAEADSFLADRSASAREKVVDRLLASPRFGQRMAVPWLDLARYADSYGYQSDQLTPMWPYRDWVVRAFNENLPYDQFIAWQLAGDLLPTAGRDQRLATAFNRLHRMTNEGGSVPDEWRLEGVADRVNTLGTAFLGLTLECARCHDHKYDPVSQRDYYALSAFLNNIDEHGLYDRADIIPSPSLLLPTPEQEAGSKHAAAAVASAEEQLRTAVAGGETRFQSWLASRPMLRFPDQLGRFDFERFDGVNLPNRLRGAAVGGVRSDEVPLAPGHRGNAAQLDGENNINFPNLARFERHTPFTVSFWIWDPRIAAEPTVLYQACAGTDTGPHGYDLMLQDGRLSARMYRHWPGNAFGVRTVATVPKETWTQIAVTYDGSSRAAGLRIYLNGKPLETSVLRDRIHKGFGRNVLTFGQRFRDKGFRGGRLDDLQLFERSLSALEVARLFADPDGTPARLTEDVPEAQLREYYFNAVDPDARAARAALTTARQQWVAAEEAQQEIAVMDEMSPPRAAYVLARGRYDAPQTDATRVNRDTPRSISPYPAGAPRNRLGLAQWLTQPNHPLTSRVAVNRLWALMFGRGLVETQENFGLQGTMPSHPELLDWLARDFVNSGWNVKGALRQIALSRTYGQASAVRGAGAAGDPNNILLSRGPSHRLSAESIRDAALALGGVLEDRLGGPPVSPYQPGDLWREANTMSPAYRQSVGGDLYRRSLYTVWKRTAPMPNMMAFDSVSREVCVARRQPTNTPLQALVLLNDPQFVEAARLFGERILKDGGADPVSRVRYAFRAAATREPNAGEAAALLRLYEGERARYRSDPAAAARVLAVGSRKPDPGQPASELAAAAVLGQAVLNLDVTIWKR